MSQWGGTGFNHSVRPSSSLLQALPDSRQSLSVCQWLHAEPVSPQSVNVASWMSRPASHATSNPLPRLMPVQRQAQKLEAIKASCKQVLPEPLAPAVRCRLAGGCPCSPAWVTQNKH